MAEIPKIVSQRLHAAARAKVHPDPDLITAFVEKSLGKRERVQVLEHLSRCASCREIVSLSAGQPDIAGTVSLAPVSPGWLSWPVLRWGAAVACVIVVGAAVTLRHKQEASGIAPRLAEGKPTAEVQIQAPDSAFAKKAASPQLADREAKTAVMAKQAEQSGQASSNSPATQPAPVAGASPVQMPAASGSMFATTATRQKARTANPADGNYAAATPSSVEMADARTGSPLAEVVPGRAKAALAESQDAQAGKVIGGALLKKRNMAAPVGAANLASDASFPANLAPRWTLSSDGTLQRSLDSGGTWQTIPVSSRTIFRALAANGLDIWVGGSAGALFHSSDAGRHWAQLRPVANGEALSDDIIGVEFTDLLHGKLTTSSAETWITADAGQTWQRQ
jgi:Photosynthesis system II assembly factor YCF48/Putative zinc-finger